MEHEKRPSRIKRRDIGIVGAIVALTQVLSSFQGSHSVSNEVSKLREDLQSFRVEQERYFVRKTELKSVAKKIDSINSQLSTLSNQMISLKAVLKSHFQFDAKAPKLFDKTLTGFKI